MISKLKHLLIGNPLPTEELSEKKLNKIRALAAFSPDALSSIAYANQEIYLGLVIAGSLGLMLAFPIGIVITILLIIVAISYYQTIHGYPSGGGSYVVARENLGTRAGLVAGAALMLDYVMTAAVSLTAGVEAIASAFPALWPHRTAIALGLLMIITLANLRGLRETGTIMSIPVYLFLFTYLPMLALGLYKLVQGGAQVWDTSTLHSAAPITIFMVLHTFATGCTALTGIEAISNGVPAFRPPEARNAGRTLIVMAVLMAVLFLGTTALVQYLGILADSQETILSALTRNVFGNGFAHVLIQTTTMMILAVAANTSFAGFPRLSAILASDGFLPRPLNSLGDRLVFTNGILSLSGATAILIILFGGDSHALIPLFAVGVFLAFTLSQVGMVIHWRKVRQQGWQVKAFLNGLGAFVTFTTLIIVGYSKFLEGAWLSIVLIAVTVFIFYKINAHYQEVRQQLSLKGLPPDIRPSPVPRVVVPISGVHRGIFGAIDFARGITNDVTAVYVEIEPGGGEKVRQLWRRWFPDLPLVVLPSPYRSIVQPILKYLDDTDLEHNDGQLATVVLPEFVPAKWWHAVLHNQTTWMLKTALLYRRRNLGYQRVIIDVPFHLKK